MLLADAFAIGFDLVGGLCVAVVWPWLAGSSVLSAMQAQLFMDITVYSISSATPFSSYETAVELVCSTMSRAPHPLPILLPAVRSVLKCMSSPFQALCPSSQVLGSLQQNWSTGLGEKKVKPTIEVIQDLGEPDIVIGQCQQVLAP